MSETEELLRAQLIQCTTAMREVCTRLENANLADENEVIRTVNECFDMLYEARGTAVAMPGKLADCERNRQQEINKQVRQVSDSLAEAHRRREIAAKQCEDQAETISLKQRNLITAQAQVAKLQQEKQKLTLDQLTLDGRNDELALEVTKLRAYKKRFVALAVEFDEETEA